MRFGLILVLAMILSMCQVEAGRCSSIYKKYYRHFKAMDTNKTKYVTVWEFQAYMKKVYWRIWYRVALKHNYKSWSSTQKATYWRKYRSWLARRMVADKKGFYKTFHKYGVYWKDVSRWIKKRYHC